MKKLQCTAIVLMLLAPIASNADEYICEHKEGEYTYGESKIYVVKRSGSAMVIPSDEHGKSKEDSWSYRVVAESSSFGFRAIRLAPDSTIPSDEVIDIAVGGEIILLKQKNSISLVTVGINASNNNHDFELFTCVPVT